MSIKRGAEEQLRRENLESEEDETDDGNNQQTWNRASEEVLKTRKIVKVKHANNTLIPQNLESSENAVEGGNNNEKAISEHANSNPFANIAIATSSLNSASTTDKPKLHIDTSTNPFATISLVSKEPAANASTECQGFLAYTNVNPFKAAIITPTSTISSKSPPMRANPFASTSPSVNPFMSFVEKKDELWNTMSKGTEGVLHTSNINNTVTSKVIESIKTNESKKDGDDADSGGENNDEKDEAGDEKADFKPLVTYTLQASGPVITGEENEECVTELRVKLFRLVDGTIWTDIGTGPLRVLKEQQGQGQGGGRVVMRRESQPGGQGTKLLVNVSLNKLVDIDMHGDRAVRLTHISTTISDTLPENDAKSSDDITTPKAIAITYVFKTKTHSDADMLFKSMTNIKNRTV